MNKRDAALAALVSMGIGLTGTVVASQLDVQLDSTLQEEARKAEPKGKPDYPPRVYETVGGPKQWDQVADVIVVGSGAAGLMAGISALWTKPDISVIVLESDGKVGGTTAKSGGVFWLPNNVKMSVPDDREKTIRLLARLGFPEYFDESKPRLGLPEEDYSRLCQFYDLGRPLSQQLQGISYNLTRFRDSSGRFIFDYTYSPESQPDNVAPQQRHLGVGMPTPMRAAMKGAVGAVTILLPLFRWLQAKFPGVRELTTLTTFGLDLTYGFGEQLVAVLEREFTKTGQGCIQLERTVDGLIRDDGAVVGVRVFNAAKNKHEFIGARRGVVFASGGYSQDLNLVDEYFIKQNHFVQRTGACKGNTGVLLHLAPKIDATLDEKKLGRMWGCEAVYNEKVEEWEAPTCLFQMRGDSFFVVGPLGTRVYNEKLKYDQRARKHFELSPDSCADASKGVFFMVGDARCQNIFGGEVLANSWLRDPNDPRYIVGNTIEELAKNIKARFPQFVNQAQFESNLKTTFERFNEFARTGKDLDFKRGETPSDEQWTEPAEKTKYPTRAMHPLSTTGPYYALPIVASIIDTKWGPKVDTQGRVLARPGSSDRVIDRLYAAGNCAASLTGDAYMSGGLTLGPALVSGYVAGMHAVLRGPGGAKL